MRSLIEKIKRIVFWGWKLRNNYDFDAGYMYEVMYLKFDRLYYGMLAHSHCVWNSSPSSKLMRRLYEARGLAKKLSESEYGRHSHTFLEKYYRINEYNPNGVNFCRPIGVNAKLVSQEFYSYGLKKTLTRDENERKIDQKRLYHLMERYIDVWWD